MAVLALHNIWLYLILPVIFHPRHFVPIIILHKRDSLCYFYGSNSHIRQAMGVLWGEVWGLERDMSLWNGMWAAKTMLHYCKQMLGIKQKVKLPNHCLWSIKFDLWIFYWGGIVASRKWNFHTSKDHYLLPHSIISSESVKYVQINVANVMEIAMTETKK